MADTVTVIGTGGTIYEMDFPAEGTHAHERFTAQLASGDLREVRAEWVEKTYGADKDGKPLVSRHLVEIFDETPAPATKATKAELAAAAVALGIEVDPKWTKDEIAGAIEWTEAVAAAAAASQS